MAKYDDASWHYGGDFPKDLPKINGATHIGLFLTWVIDNNLLPKEQIEDFEEDIQSVKNRTLTGSEFLMNNYDGKFTDEDLNELGNEFANTYYEGNSDFCKIYQDYLGDYSEIFQIKVENGMLDQDSLYRVGNSWANYYSLKSRIDQRFEEWKQFKHPK